MDSQPRCANCTKPIQVTAAAPHKRFCGVTEGDTTGRCRDEWHHARRKRALQALTKQEQATEEGL